MPFLREDTGKEGKWSTDVLECALWALVKNEHFYFLNKIAQSYLNLPRAILYILNLVQSWINYVFVSLF